MVKASLLSGPRLVLRSDKAGIESIKARAQTAKMFSDKNEFKGEPCDPFLAITEWFNNGFYRMRRLDKAETKLQILTNPGTWITITASPIAIDPDKP